jgi:hypothetical protein
VVDLSDFNRFRDGFQSNAKSWSGGDFDLSGSVDLADFQLYLRGFQYQPTPRVTAELLAALGDLASAEGIRVDLSALPEPSATALAMFAASAVLRRHRARRASAGFVARVFNPCASIERTG